MPVQRDGTDVWIFFPLAFQKQLCEFRVLPHLKIIFRAPKTPQVLAHIPLPFSAGNVTVEIDDRRRAIGIFPKRNQIFIDFRVSLVGCHHRVTETRECPRNGSADMKQCIEQCRTSDGEVAKENRLQQPLFKKKSDHSQSVALQVDSSSEYTHFHHVEIFILFPDSHRHAFDRARTCRVDGS